MPAISTTPLVALAQVIRSKNAGPTQLTIDVFFHDVQGFDAAVASPALSRDAVAALYQADPAAVERHLLPAVLALKFSMPRRICAGDPGDGDVYGAQQHAPLLGVML